MAYSVVGIRISPGMQHSWRTVRAVDGTISRIGIKSLCTAAAQGVKPAQSRWMLMIGGRAGTDALHAVMLRSCVCGVPDAGVRILGGSADQCSAVSSDAIKR
ncbi:hypothetical protein ACKAWT_19185 [Xanthomonas vasicola]|uniref:Uncharacterized protein n=1 Tax=Xanthomonas vasicola pv. vasculorum TaxID=325776 RepID=A0AAE8F6Q3_XANVA|nr:hypothetical protein [Xanthomonas vasicola]AVQ06297.1 hypothetical protein C7V42_06430 [Xanthomonas vasicola pv. vasculorum]AZM70498.1 hypothetical protein CXP37_06435 [Xanthomonas vasicola pv. vasculorum]MBV6748183.1 hypothetical protein [Xanthomonas vasicola pv. vasculorum NCPPB 890]MBV6893856.1 hypothetical protein [Xanthomonas vasicola pv. vasculorum]MBV7303399.1 hypothetical protein [Xanthomonas vasicola pv. vasculorum]